jgi:hypothetical protein
MIGIGKPSQFGREPDMRSGSCDFVGFSAFGALRKAKKARSVRRFAEALHRTAR